MSGLSREPNTGFRSIFDTRWIGKDGVGKQGSWRWRGTERMMREPVDWPTFDLLTHRVRTTPDRTALLAAETGAEWTYRELDDEVDDVSRGLTSIGIGHEDRVGSLLDTRVAFVRLVHATMRVGAVLVLLDVRLTQREVRNRIDRADLDALVCDADTESVAVGEFDGSVISVDEPHDGDVDPIDGFVTATRTTTDVPRHLSRNDRAVTMFTSGTTGDPKPVELTIGNLVASATASAFRLGVDADDRWLVCLPMYHMGGLAPVVRSTLYGTTVVVQQTFDPTETADVIDRFEVTGVSLVPTMLTRMLDTGWTPPERLRFVLLGGAPASRDLIERCEINDVPVHPTYGMTETASQVATARPEDAFEHPGTVGQPLVFTTVRIVDDDGDRCEAGEVGELIVDGPTVTPGYDDETDATETRVGDRGLRTGDVGYRDQDGRLWILGRRDDRIITGGENVYPGEVADVLRSYPGIREAAVVGVEDPEWGERIAALVVPESDDQTMDHDVLDAHCRERLAGYKCPKTVVAVDSLPRTASGTIDRESVRERLASRTRT